MVVMSAVKENLPGYFRFRGHPVSYPGVQIHNSPDEKIKPAMIESALLKQIRIVTKPFLREGADNPIYLKVDVHNQEVSYVPSVHVWLNYPGPSQLWLGATATTTHFGYETLNLIFNSSFDLQVGDQLSVWVYCSPVNPALASMKNLRVYTEAVPHFNSARVIANEDP